MCGTQPEAGADAPRRFRVLLVDRMNDDERPYWVDVPHAYGRHDVKNQILDAMPTALILEVQEQ